MASASNVSGRGLSSRVPALTDAWLDRLDAVSADALGVSDVRGTKLADAVARVSHAYNLQRDALAELQGDDDALCARLKFFLPRDLLKVHGPLSELHALDALPKRTAWRVLDLGAGLGSTSLGAARFAALSGCAERLQVTAVDIDAEALALFERVAPTAALLPGVAIELRTLAADLRQPAALRAQLSPPYDVILMGLALNELHAEGAATAAAASLMEISGLLADDGVLIVLEPALRETSRVLHAVRDVLAARAARPHVFAPCLRSAPCPMLARPRDYCHERVPHALPPRLAELAQRAGLRDADLTYSYLTLHAQPRSLNELAANRPDVSLYRAVSAPLPSKGKLELWLCGAQAAPRAMRLDRHASPDNAAIESAGRGSLLRIAGTKAGDGDEARLRITQEVQIEQLLGWEAEER
ncbi:MAG TPA: small ribosomal subunit Rsm22 family protein [Polyangiales bacterium]|jgi:SAM-dependent methyltransferase|nr:small ribosomal subunit Rsm22 family protein [Polyangiales bacterium]